MFRGQLRHPQRTPHQDLKLNGINNIKLSVLNMVSGGAENYSFRMTYMNENMNCIYIKNHSLYYCTASSVTE